MASQRKVFVHHYTQYMEAANFDHAYETVSSLVEEYRAQDLGSTGTGTSAPVVRMRPMGVF